MLCFKFRKLSNIIMFYIRILYTSQQEIYGSVIILISKLEYAVNRNCQRLLSDLIRSMNLYILGSPPVVLKLYMCQDVTKGTLHRENQN